MTSSLLLGRLGQAGGGSGAGASTRFIEAQIATGQNSFSQPVTYWPIVAKPVIGPVFCSIPFVVPPASYAAYVLLRTPDDGGADVTINYIELTVTNFTGSEILSVYTSHDIVIPPNTEHGVSFAEFGGSTPNVNIQVGTDLAMTDLFSDGTGIIGSTAGGVFAAQMSFDITPPL